MPNTPDALPSPTPAFPARAARNRVMPAPHEDAPATQQARFWLDRAEQLAHLKRKLPARQALDQAQRAVAQLEAEPAWAIEWTKVQAELLYFEDHTEASIPLLLAARNQAEALARLDLAAQCAACAALHLSFAGRFDAASEQAMAALRLAPEGEHGTRYRALLALANMCDWAGLLDTAHGLYRRAHLQAKAAGDQRGIGATIARMACTQAIHAALRSLREQHDAEALKQAVVGMRATIQWSQDAGAAADPVDHVLLAVLLRLQGHADQADALLQQWLPLTALEETPTRRVALSERARCCALLGDLPLALGLCDEAIALPAHLGSGSDRWWNALALANVAEVHALASSPMAAASAAAAAAELGAHEHELAADQALLKRHLLALGLA